ncbi:hypothetical protein [Massilia cavernae]|uniref:Uncharacterized protein n=1 Tax=Massilia cavernae TaxID=2320864 RepID=A0A418Y646_9BURK|nr:hypothetical protein [Massilia cavernae]RJG22686.1 hypothetical protein D3872_05120 [Massilia cavernae]
MVTESRDRRVNTDARVLNEGVKRMPHERDESPDTQEVHPRGVMEQAASDLEQGLVDTDLHGQRGIEQAVQHTDTPGQAKPRDNAGEGMRHTGSGTPRGGKV